MEIPKLNSEESSHIENGGRVFIVEEISGPLWRILSISKNRIRTLCRPEIPEVMEGYSELETARNLAFGIAALSEDDPMVRVV